MGAADAADRARAARLRRRIRNGRRPLREDERAWLADYERATGVDVRVADVVVGGPSDEAAGAGASTGAESAEDEPVGETESQEEEPEAEPPPVTRIARAGADRVDHGTALLIQAVEMHERVSTRALAMMERMGELAAQQSEQLVDALEALALARAELVERQQVVEAEQEPAGEASDVDAAILEMLGQRRAQQLPAQAPRRRRRKPQQKTAEVSTE